MTPQLQQAIKLLQLSSQELEAQILEALETNPLLEREENLESDAEAEDERGNGEDRNGSEVEPEQLAAEDVDWGRYESAMPASGATGAKRNYDGESQLEIPDGEEEDLCDHLLWQLHLSHLSRKDTAIGIAIIDAINDQGYLTESLAALQDSLRPDHEVDIEEIEAVLHRIQRFDPVGVACRDLSECLHIQLAMVSDDTPGHALAQRLIDGHLDQLARQDIAGMKRELEVGLDELKEAIGLVRSLDPRPGSRISGGTIEYVKPDVIVERRDGDWHVRLHDDLMPRLGINNYYANLISKARKDDADYLRGRLQEARWLLKSLETRNDTLLKVGTAIVEHQQAFFDQGPEAMKPLVLREIAETIEMHESTVSRVTTRKYMLTPRGVFEFKYFFSSHVGTSDGGECSATAIQAMIRKLIEDEKPARPLSDARIASILNDKGIDVARRTVAKYREAMNIPASSKRKRLI